MASGSLTDLAADADAALSKGNFVKAEQLYRQCVVADPNNGLWLRNLGIALNAQQMHVEAEPFLRKAAAITSDVISYKVLANVLVETHRAEEARHILNKITAQFPKDADAWRLLGSAALRAGDRVSSRTSLLNAAALEPTNEAVLQLFSSASLPDDPGSAADLYRRAVEQCGDDWRLRTQLLRELVPLAEKSERMGHGMPSFRATDINDRKIHFAVNELKAYAEAAARWAEASPDDPKCWINQGLAAHGLGRLEDAEAYFAFARDPASNTEADPRKISDVATFDPAFYGAMDQVDPIEISRDLPVIIAVSPADFIAGHVLFVSCDRVYFDHFAKPLLRSIAANVPKAQVHVHLMDADANFIGAAADFLKGFQIKAKLTVESPPAFGDHAWNAKLYYHAIRFIRLFQFLNDGNCCYWLMDADGLVRRDPAAALNQIEGYDVALTVRPPFLEPWQRFCAGIVGVRPSPAGLRYVKLVAASMAALYRRGELRWGIDQFFLYAGFEFLARSGAAPKVRTLGEDTLDFGTSDYRGNPPFWMKTGRQKWISRELALTDTSAVPGDESYVAELRKYL